MGPYSMAQITVQVPLQISPFWEQYFGPTSRPTTRVPDRSQGHRSLQSPGRHLHAWRCRDARPWGIWRESIGSVARSCHEPAEMVAGFYSAIKHLPGLELPQNNLGLAVKGVAVAEEAGKSHISPAVIVACVVRVSVVPVMCRVTLKRRRQRSSVFWTAAPPTPTPLHVERSSL